MRTSNLHSRTISASSYNSITILEKSLLNTEPPIQISNEPPLLQEELPPIEKVDTYNILVNLLPNIFNQLMHFMVNIIFGHFLGSVNDIPLLNGVNFGIIYNNIFLYFISFGIVQGMAVFCPNSFSQKNFLLIGIQTNHVRIIVMGIFIVFFFITFFFGKHLLIFLSGSNDHFIDIAYTYVLFSEIGNFFEMYFEIHCKYCESQLFYKPIVHTLVISIVANFILCFFFISYFNWGAIGAAMAFNLTNMLKFLYVYFAVEYINPYPLSNFWFKKEILDFTIFKEVFKICFMSMLITYSEYLGYALSNIFSVRLSQLSYATYNVIGNVYLITYPISLGVNNTVTILTSYFFGLKQKNNIVKSMLYIIFYSFLMNVPIWGIFTFFRKGMTRFFSESKEIYEKNDLLSLYIINSCTQIFDTLQNALQGQLRGIEILDILSYGTFIIFLIGMPSFNYFFAFTCGWDVKGVFASELVSYFLMFALLFYWLMYRIDLDKICAEEEEKEEDTNKIEMKEISN